MEEKKKHKVMIGIEVILLGMIIAIVGTKAASSNPPSNGVSYSKNSQTTVEGALNDLYNKANYGNASAGDILSGKTALVGGSKVTGTMPDRRFTGNVTGGLNATYPNIALNVGGNTQLTTGTNGIDYIATSPPQGWYEGGGSSYTVIPKSTVISLYGITANKILKGQSIAGINGTGETTCPTPESQGYWKVYNFDKDATYTRTSTGTNTTLGSRSWTRLCASNKECTYTFKVPLDSGITVNKLHSCSVILRPNHYAGSIPIDYSDAARRSSRGFRINRGTSSSGTAEYWYIDDISANRIYDNVNPNVNQGGNTLWWTWNESGFTIATNTGITPANPVETSCDASRSEVTMTIKINNNALATYDNEFILSGSIVYQ